MQEAGSDNENTPVRPSRRFAPLVFYTLALLLLAELVVALVLPSMVPEQVYLDLYLSKEARENTRRFVNDSAPFLIYDEIAGWRNRPDVAHQKWVIDGRGSRSTHAVSTDRARRTQVIFLGNSLVNGSSGVSNDETISAYIEDETTASSNFAAMLYSLDQSYLAYKHRLGEYKADVVVVGLGATPGAGLMNRYIPFRFRQEHNMPFFKPRFELTGNTLNLIPLPPKQAYEEIFSVPAILSNLASSDAHYNEFKAYTRFGLTPIFASIRYIYNKAQRLVSLINHDDRDAPLLKALMSAMVMEAESRGAIVIFMMLPDQTTTAPGRLRGLLPDHYGSMVKELSGAGFNVLDARETLRRSGMPMRKLFYYDGIHYTAVGNREIATGLKTMIGKR
ncbi:MAG: hypothetical protein HY886_02890 [Deltaproteobacteria bacterium]|nr:hypothetical protein [Deltaproteobacteria bacterium]